MLLSSLSLFIHQFLSLSFAPSSPEALNSTHRVFVIVDTLGKRGGGGGYGRPSEGLMHPNEKRHLYSHRAFSVSLHIYPPNPPLLYSARRYLSHTPLFSPPTPPSTLTQWRCPVFHLAARRSCVNVLSWLRNATSSVAAVA